jgi:heme ABC exporter ATP-binding subunit CcmA
MEPAVHLRSAVALLGRFPALTGVDLDVEAGEIVLVTGSNGAGKTTLLRCCAGLVQVASGTARVLDVDLVADRAAVRPMVGLLGHATGLYDELSVTDNLRFWARAARVPTPDAVAAMDRVGLAERLRGLPVSHLSAGQRRRASLAAMIVRRPQLWLLDEPHAGFDQGARDHLDGLVLEAAAAGATVLFASHELARAGTLATRAVEIVGGAVVDGATSDAAPLDGPPLDGTPVAEPVP